jgi:hypothetical protein
MLVEELEKLSEVLMVLLGRAGVYEDVIKVNRAKSFGYERG